ncbi:MAG: twin-arginine translocase subunit TatC [Actinomycetaceae bacterium]|nr:twin-arginine translocase subunit TatC [Actinomycetaceae bacterium]
MPIPDHLRELRARFLLAAAGVGLGAIGGWFVCDPVLDFIQAPLARVADARTQINFQTIGAALDLRITLCLWIGFIVTCPWWIYQIWAFISPGLRRREKAYALSFGLAGIALFAAGAGTGVWLAPRAVDILQSFVPDGAASLLHADAYIQFYMRLVVAFGLSFLLPEVLVALNFLRLLSSRAMLRGWRWATVIAFGFAAVANPLPSPWPMVVQGLVLVALYLAAVAISWVNERHREYGWRLRPGRAEA